MGTSAVRNCFNLLKRISVRPKEGILETGYDLMWFQFIRKENTSVQASGLKMHVKKQVRDPLKGKLMKR